MVEGAEKRVCHRFEIPGAEGRYKKKGLLGLFADYSEPHPVMNVSKGGLALQCDEAFRKGTKLKVQLLLPDMEPLEFHAQVRWRGTTPDGVGSVVGVQFSPFGSRVGWNPLEMLDMLRGLEAKYVGSPEKPDEGA